MNAGTPIRKRRAAKYVRGGFRTCYHCGFNPPDEIHHTSYFPEEAVAVCEGCHSHIHSNANTGLEPDEQRPENYETIRRRQEKQERYNSRSWQINRKLKLDANHTAANSSRGGDFPHPEIERGEHL